MFTVARAICRSAISSKFARSALIVLSATAALAIVAAPAAADDSADPQLASAPARQVRPDRPPPAPGVGRCCFPNGTCQVTAQVTCTGAGGTYAGDLTDCNVAGGEPTEYPRSPNVTIPDNNATGVSDTDTISDSYTVGKATVDIVIPDHTNLGQLLIRLSHGATTVTLWDHRCPGQTGLVVTFSDDGDAVVCDTPTTGTIRPAGPAAGQLQSFVGAESSGAWTLTVIDNAAGGVGTLVNWTLTLDRYVDPCNRCGSTVRGDANGDGRVDNFDIDPFVLAVVDALGYMNQFCNDSLHCMVCRCDVNQDGELNNFDIDPFVTCLTSGGCH